MKVKSPFLLIATIIILTLIVSACGSGEKRNNATNNQSNSATNDTPSQTEETNNVVFHNGVWAKDTEEILSLRQEQEKTFKEQYPHVEIKSEAFQYDATSFLPLAVSGQLPNLFSTWFTEPTKIVGGGYAKEITKELEEYGYIEALNPDLMDIVTFDNGIYGIPYEGYNIGVWYNMNLFKEADLLNENGLPTFPQTYEELVQTAVTIKERTGKAGFFFPTKNNQGGWLFSNIAWSYGAEFIEPVEGGGWKAVFNSQEAVDALNLVKDMKWKHHILQENILSDIGDMQRLFGTDQVAMSFGTVDWMNGPVNDYEMSKDNLAMSRVPAGPAGRYSLTGGNTYMFSENSTSEQVKAGIDWLQTIGFSLGTSEDALLGLDQKLKSDSEIGRITGPAGLRIWVNEERVAAEQAIREKYTNVDMKLWNDFIDSEDVQLKPEAAVNVQELYKAMDSVIQAVLTDENADVQSLLDKAVADFQADYLDKQE